MALLIDQHHPRKMEELDFHPEVTNILESFVRAKSIPNLMVYGPPNSGKKTRIMATLRELYGKDILKTKQEIVEIVYYTKRTERKNPNSKMGGNIGGKIGGKDPFKVVKIKHQFAVPIVSSRFHVEWTPPKNLSETQIKQMIWKFIIPYAKTPLNDCLVQGNANDNGNTNTNNSSTIVRKKKFGHQTSNTSQADDTDNVDQTDDYGDEKDEKKHQKVKKKKKKKERYEKNGINFRVVIINSPDNLKLNVKCLFEAMEKTAHCCRFICITRRLVSIPGPFKSRLFLLRVPAPTKDEVRDALAKIIAPEVDTDVDCSDEDKNGEDDNGGSGLDPEIYDSIAVPKLLTNSTNVGGLCDSNGERCDYRRALLYLSASVMITDLEKKLGHSYLSTSKPPATELVVIAPQIETFFREIAADILFEQSGEQMLKVAGKLHQLLKAGISATTIITNLSKLILRQTSNMVLGQRLTELAAAHEHYATTGTKSSYHVEGFVAAIMQATAEFYGAYD